MKKNTIIILAFLMSCFAYNALYAEDASFTEFEVFSVPESPAFLLLDPGDSVVLKPTTVREFTIQAAKLLNADKPGIFAAEFSPGLLFGGNKDDKFFNHLRISLAGENAFVDGGSNLGLVSGALGIRYSFDKKNPVTKAAEFDKEFSEDDNKKKGKKVFLKEKKDKLIGQWAENATDIGIAILGNSTTGTVDKLTYSKFGVWVSHAQKLPSSKHFKSQIIITGYASLEETKVSGVLDAEQKIALRPQFGSNERKLFLEFDLNYASTTGRLSMIGLIGGEFNLGEKDNKNAWVEMYFGGRSVSGSADIEYIADLHIKYAL